MIEAATADPSERTKLNVRDSDGTLILIKSVPIGEGTQLTIDEAKRLSKPLLVINLNKQGNNEVICEWLQKSNIKVLNVAGPRASESVDIYNAACQVLKQCLVSITRAPQAPLKKPPRGWLF